MGSAFLKCCVVVGLLAGAHALAAQNPKYKRLADESWESVAVRGALRGAQRRLASSKCQELLDDFSDASGRRLRANLDALGQTPEGYLDLLIFYDAAGSSRCASSDTLAMTSAGNRAIFVCADRFAKKVLVDRRQTEIILIHEALHSLGLGENPPSSSAITAQVMSRCR